MEYCRARGLDVSVAPGSETWLREKGPFAVAVLLDVIEHLSEPTDMLSRIHRELAPGGLVVISTGDWGSLVSRAFGSHWRLMTPPQHLFFFSHKTLPLMLERLGFRVVELTHPGKRVPVGLIAYQLARMLALSFQPKRDFGGIGIPVNLFDAMRVIAVKT